MSFNAASSQPQHEVSFDAVRREAELHGITPDQLLDMVRALHLNQGLPLSGNLLSQLSFNDNDIARFSFPASNIGQLELIDQPRAESDNAIQQSEYLHVRSFVPPQNFTHAGGGITGFLSGHPFDCTDNLQFPITSQNTQDIRNLQANGGLTQPMELESWTGSSYHKPMLQGDTNNDDSHQVLENDLNFLLGEDFENHGNAFGGLEPPNCLPGSDQDYGSSSLPQSTPGIDILSGMNEFLQAPVPSMTENSSCQWSSSSQQPTPPSMQGSSPRPSKSDRMPEAIATIVKNAATQGPCSNTWDLPRKKRGLSVPDKKATRKPSHDNGIPRRRKPFADPKIREETKHTRHLGACIRCHLQKIRCLRDSANPTGSCLTCRRLSGSSIPGQPCLRYKITDASLYREQEGPWREWTERWPKMEGGEITEWASSDIRTIEVTHGFGSARYKLRVREFIPIPGDKMAERWTDGYGNLKEHPIPHYAIADKKEAEGELHRYMDESIWDFIKDSVNWDDPLLRLTYRAAVYRAEWAPDEKERKLLQSTLRLWVAARMTSNVEWICGEETLGIPRVDDELSPWFKHLPKPAVMCSQCEIISYTTLLRPYRKQLLSHLQSVIQANKREYWYTIYLTLFLLLHSCAMITRRDEELARQMMYSDQFCNPLSITEHHVGSKTMLAYFHYLNKGAEVFSMVRSPDKRQAVMEAAGLKEEQLGIIEETSELLEEKRNEFHSIKEKKEYGHDYYFISQLFEKEWRPSPTA
ncbi:MAG: hypothetical protein M1820_008150 [Bogoriella megaspora]|nr:MAG: hypothetical protein M1820_008150 [Bogoriella megaspora]